MNWPIAELDSLRRLRVMADVLPGVGMVETVLNAPFDQVWGFIADLESSVPAFDPAVASLKVISRYDDRLVIKARTVIPITYNVELRPGWCWMQSRVYLVGMAAVAEGNRTRYAHLEGLPQRGTGLLEPLFRRVVVPADIRGIRRSLGLPRP